MINEISPTAKNEHIYANHLDSLHNNNDLVTTVTPTKFLDGDKWNLAKLLFLYILQGIPLGIAEAFPLILKSKHFSYYDQAIFSTSMWPFTIKILWAPLVDSVYYSKVDRRKMWLVPVHLLLGTCLLLCSVYNDYLLTNTEKSSKIVFLTITWTAINCLAATQDIVIDGWACSMLQKHNIHYASTCNGTGQSLGSFLGFSIPLLLGSEKFCNKWLRFRRRSGGLVTFEGCLYFWGILFIIAAICVSMFKKETQLSIKKKHLSIWNAYKLLWAVMKLPNIRILGAIVLTAKIGFATIDTATNMEFMEAGVSEHSIVIIGMVLYLVKIIVPITLTATTNATTALDLYIKYVPIRFIHGLAFSLLLYYAPTLLNNVSIIQTCFYVLLGLTYATNQACMYVMYVSYISFITGISDPNFGGIYMSLLGTFSNVSIAVSKTVSLWFLDVLTFKQCSNNSHNYCTTLALTESCQATDGICDTIISGYYAEIVISTILGISWYYIIKNPIIKLQSSDKKKWLVSEEQYLVMESI